jgi:endonuclease-3
VEGRGSRVKSDKPKAQSRGKRTAKTELRFPRESLKTRKQRAAFILAAMEQLYPQAATELNHTSAFELLIATVLSAQATDASVNKATPALFRHYPDAFALAEARPEELEPYIRTIGLYRSKAKNLVMLARMLVEQHNGEVPVDKTQLLKLPGVGWKTATVVLGAAFGVPGIAVDTHLVRLAGRLGLSDQTDPEKIGADLEKVFPKEKWVFVHHALILFGRYCCTARRPRCQGCPLFDHCLSKGAW